MKKTTLVKIQSDEFSYIELNHYEFVAEQADGIYENFSICVHDGSGLLKVFTFADAHEATIFLKRCLKELGNY